MWQIQDINVLGIQDTHSSQQQILKFCTDRVTIYIYIYIYVGGGGGTPTYLLPVTFHPSGVSPHSGPLSLSLCPLSLCSAT
jgi:hypothetical protein